MAEPSFSACPQELQNVRVLLISDQDGDTTAIESQLYEGHIINLRLMKVGAQGVLASTIDPTDIVILDTSLCQDNALNLLKTLRMTHPEVPVIFATEQKDMYAARDALLNGAASYLTSEEITASSLATTITQLAKKVFRQREADLLHSDMVFMMSHDLLTPLTNILGYSQALMHDHSDDLNTFQTQAVSRIVSNSLYMNSLMESILTGIKIEAGTISVRPRLEDLPTLINAALERNQYLANRKGVTFSRSLGAERLSVSMDPTNLSQVMNNLIANATKFTPRNSTIRVGFDLLPGKVRVFVVDQGPGMSNLDQGSLFRKFPHVSMSVHSHEEGNGLGLFIVAHLVRINHGEVGVDCPETGGTEFWFTLPLEAQAALGPVEGGGPNKQLPGRPGGDAANSATP